MMGFVHPGVGIRSGVDHDPVDEVIHDCRDAVYTPQPLIKTWFILAIQVSLLGFDLSIINQHEA